MILVKTERLILESFSVCDVDEYFDILNDSEIKRFIKLKADTKEDVEKIIIDYVSSNSNNYLPIKISDRVSGKMIGAIIAYSVSTDSLNVSYFIKEDYRCEGLMTEALKGFINYLYIDTANHYYYLYFTIKDDNIASKIVIEKCGARLCNHIESSKTYLIKIDAFFEIL